MGQCSKTLKLGLKVPGRSRLCRYFEDRLIWVPRMTKCRTETYKASFIPSTTRVWNELPQGSRNLKYVSQRLKIKPNLLFYEGSRINNIKYAQHWMQCNELNAHLFLLHVVDLPQCIYGHEVEESENTPYLNCSLYSIQRQEML